MTGAIVAIAALAALGAGPGAADAATAQHSPITRAAAGSSAIAAPPGCDPFQLENAAEFTWLQNTSGKLKFGTMTDADIFCQTVVSGSNVVIYDLGYGNDDSCLAYSAASASVYLHANCPDTDTPSYEQWKFIPVPPSGAKHYMLENAYNDECMAENGSNPPLMAGCNASNEKVVMFYDS